MPSSTSGKSSNVVGGHADAFKTGPAGTIQKRADPMEVSFYEAAFNDGTWPTRFLPGFYGASEGSDGSQMVTLQNLSHEFKRPCVLDLKMGKQTFLPGATAESVCTQPPGAV